MVTKWEVFKRYLRSLGRINREESEEDTRTEILQEVSFKGANIWLLGFTMILACIGLNMNSAYAIIGAMLMSPLMAPVIGMGFSLATNNWKMFQRCLYNWIWSLVISLAASTLYFYITPFSQPTEALISFSHATIYDILLAFFGGFAAFIGITRMRGTKVLAGVAVATACMPPLSTAGYGLANMHWQYFFGGSYLYIINCIYIGLAVMLLAKYMHFKKEVAFREKPLRAKIIYVLAIVSLVPATFFAWQLVEEKRTTNHIEQFITENLNTDRITVLKKVVNLKKNPNQVDVYIAGDILTEGQKDTLRKNLLIYDLPKLKLIIHSTPDLEAVQSEPELLKRLIVNQGKKMDKQDSIIRVLQSKVNSLNPAEKK